MKLPTPVRHIVAFMKARVRWLGLLAMVAGLAFVGLKFREQGDLLLQWRPDAGMIIGMVVSMLVYAIASHLLAHGWERLMLALGCREGVAAGSRRIYARSQIAKYLPGNVGHLVTRHALLNAEGAPHGHLGGTAAFEVAGVLAGAFAVGGMGLLWWRVGGLAGAVLALMAGVVFLLLASWFLGVLGGPAGRWLKLAGGPLSWHRLVPPLVDYGIFFLVSALLYCGVMMLLSGSGTERADVGLLIAAYAFSWMAGFLIPGAPGGLGVRESVLIFLLRDAVPAGDAVLGAMLFRVVTLSGDVLFFCSSLLPQAVVSRLHFSGWLRTTAK